MNTVRPKHLKKRPHPRKPAKATLETASPIAECTQNFPTSLFEPPADHRRLDVLYRQVREGLQREFRPRTFSQHFEIDALAHDYISLWRARQRVEAVAAAGSQFPPQEQSWWRRLCESQADLETLMRLSHFSGVPKAPLCALEEARRLARHIANFMHGLEARIAEAAPALADRKSPKMAPEPSAPDTAPHAEEDARSQRLWNTLGEAREKYLDEDFLEALLGGDRALVTEDWMRIQALLTEVARYTLFHIRANDGLLRRADELYRTSTESMAASPEPLLRAERNAHLLERLICQKLDRLRRWGR